VRESERPYDTTYRRWYGKGATYYDERFQGDFARLQADFIVDLLQPRAGMRILDVGAGTGRASLPLAAAAPEAVVVAADLTAEMLQRAVEKRDAEGMAFPAPVCANGRSLPFADASFDAVVSIRVLHLFPTPHLGAFVDEMRRVLKPGGVLLIEFNSPFAGFGWAMGREIWRRVRFGRKPRHYLWPQHIDALFGGMEERTVYGFWVPGIGRLARANPRFNGALRLARLQPPFSYLGDKILVRARKAGQPSA
jgi:ubiquinone/menaquinone biosynthesis C-methylase UbiE